MTKDDRHDIDEMGIYAWAGQEKRSDGPETIDPWGNEVFRMLALKCRPEEVQFIMKVIIDHSGHVRHEWWPSGGGFSTWPYISGPAWSTDL